MYSTTSSLSQFSPQQSVQNDIPKGQLKELVNLELMDLRKRYTKASPASMLKFPYSLLLAEDDNGEIVGTLGLDFQILDKKENKFKKLTSSSISFLETDYEEPVVVLSNLAVRPDKRKLGIGRMLLKESEGVVQTWGYNSIFLLVDSQNMNAQKLYKKCGFKAVFEGEGTCVAIGAVGLRTQECVNVCYKKVLRGGKGSGAIEMPNFGEMFSGLFRRSS